MHMRKKSIIKGISAVAGICLLGAIVISTPFRSFMNESIGEKGVEEIKNKNIIVVSEKELTKKDYVTEYEEFSEIILDELEDDLVIDKAGNYILKGKSLENKVDINVDDDEIVCLILKDVEISAQNGPAINVRSAAKVVITVEGENVLKDDAAYQGEEEACLYSNSDITINGNGILHVYGYNHDGIRSKDRVKVIGSTLFVQAKNNGIRGNDGVYLKDSVIDIQSEGIGIKTESNKDYVIIQGGSCNMVAGENAIVSECQVLIENCQWNAYAVQEKIKCNGAVQIED